MVDVVVRDQERPEAIFRGPLPADEFLDFQEQSRSFETRHFGADPAVLGRTIVLDGGPFEVVGVMPLRFTWHVADVWTASPIDRTAPDARTGRWFQAWLKPGVTTTEAASAARRRRRRSCRPRRPRAGG